MTMRKIWFAIIDIILLMTISYAESDEEGMNNSNNNELEEKEVLVGDMILSDDQINYLYSMNSTQRLGLASPFTRWPNGIVFYDVDKSLDEKGKEVVIAAMEYIENVSCVRFKVKDGKTKHFVLIKSGKACNSKVGMRRGMQPMIIDGNLCSKGSIIHELLHCLGFLHMHTANDRDDYININWKNIRDDAKLNFNHFAAPMSMFSTKYDYDSITHYSSVAFAKDKKKPTITAKKPAPNMGQRKEMSAGDITRLNRMYDCPNFRNIGTPATMKNDNDDDDNAAETKSSTQFSNGATIKQVGLNQTRDNTTNSQKNVDLAKRSIEMEELNSNGTLTNDDDDDDMILTQEQIDALYSINAAKRNGLKSAFHHWPLGVVAFEIDPTFHPEFISTIYESMSYIGNRSCIRFTPRTPYHQNYIYITKGPGCSSEVGMRQTGKQLMNINEELCPRGKIIHELLHSLGFLHMHTANERDNFIKVNWDNIKQHAWLNFKQFASHVSMFSTQYDFGSILHYSPVAFAIDRSKPTLIPLQPVKNMGQREDMSDGDVIRLNRMYNCGPSYNTGENNPPAQNPNASTTEIENHKSNSTVFGMLIFKITPQN